MVKKLLVLKKINNKNISKYYFGYENSIYVPYTAIRNISYSDEAAATTWYSGDSPCVEEVYEIQGNGAQWIVTGRDSAGVFRLKSSNIHNSWITRYNSASPLHAPVWDYLNNRWLVGSSSNNLNDGGLKSNDGVTWELIGMGSRYFLGHTFLMNSNKYLYLGSKYDAAPNPNNNYHTIIAQRNNTDTSWTTVNEFPTLFSMGLGTTRKFATNNFCIMSVLCMYISISF